MAEMTRPRLGPDLQNQIDGMIKTAVDPLIKRIETLEKSLNGYHISDHGFIEKDGHHDAVNLLMQEEPYLTLTKDQCKNIANVMNGEATEKCNSILWQFYADNEYSSFISHLADTGYF